MKSPNKTNFRIFLWIGIVAVLLFGMGRLYFRLTDDFRLGNITYDMPHHDEWDIPKLSDEERQRLDSILSQKFTYIGKGAQSYAFGSDDGKYVLKFFKFKHLTPHWFVEMFPLFPPFRPIVQSKRSVKTGNFTEYLKAIGSLTVCTRSLVALFIFT